MDANRAKSPNGTHEIVTVVLRIDRGSDEEGNPTADIKSESLSWHGEGNPVAAVDVLSYIEKHLSIVTDSGAVVIGWLCLDGDGRTCLVKMPGWDVRQVGHTPPTTKPSEN